MKENSIKKINKIGKVGSIISNIMKVFIIIGIVVCTLLSIIFFCLPKKGLYLNGKMEANLVVNLNEIGVSNEEKQEKFVMNEIEKMKESGEFKLNDNEFSVSDVTYENESILVSMETSEKNITSRDLALTFTQAVLYLVCMLIIIIFIKKLCIAIQTCETPFEETVIKRMQALAICLIPTLFLQDIFFSLMKYFVSLESKINIGINLIYVLIVLIIFTLVSIFKYGAILQQESDETL